MEQKIAVVSGWYNFGVNSGISDDNRFMINCFHMSAKKYFLPNNDVEFIFMTNSDIIIDGVVNIKFDYKTNNYWEMCLLKILSLRFLEKKYDYIFVNDNDQVYIKEVSEDLLSSDFVFLDHFYYPAVNSIYKEVTDLVELNFDMLKELWTMGNFFGGKSENMMELLDITEYYHNKYYGYQFKDQGFYSKYPEEIFILKYVFENNVNYKRLNSYINPLENTDEVFLSDWGENDNIPKDVKNVTLLHNVKKDLKRLKKFYKIMNRRNIIVCQFYTKNISYGEFSEKINRKYCDENGYLYYVEKDGDKIRRKIGDRSWTWYKPFLIEEVFSNHPDCEYILFLDIDAIFCNNSRRIEEFISEDFSILMTKDYGPSLVNAGVMLLKNDTNSKSFIKDWWDICEEYPQYKEGLWHDQTCIGLLHNRLLSPKFFKIIDNFDFNSSTYEDNKFIFHAFSYNITPNRTIDHIFHKKFNIEINSNNISLNELGKFYGTDKEYLHNYYNRFYEKLLLPFKETCDILEIGILDGSSLKVWEKFFSNGIVHGIDIKEVKLDSNRIKTFIVDQSNQNELEKFSNKNFQYDVIVDDGSHKMLDQQITIQKLFKNLKSGGYFIIEDLQTSIECRMVEKKIFGWGNPNKTTCLDMLTSILEGNPKTDYKTNEWNYFISNIESIFISSDREDSIYSIIKKKTNKITDSIILNSTQEIIKKVNERISIVYHVYLVGEWKTLIKKQLDRIILSGLYDESDEIWITVNLSNNKEEDVRNYFSGYHKINLEFHTQNNAEYPGIKKVRELCTKQDTKILYFHTKGISNNWITFDSKEPSIEKIKNVSSWRECMEYFLIDNWRECVEKLNNYDNVGVSCNGGWYWGNFWWSQSNHIKKTNDVKLWGRWDYEAWLNKNIPNSTNYEFLHMGYNPFVSNIPSNFYVTGFSEYKDSKIIVKNASYGTPPFEIDEGYRGTPINVTKDVTHIVNKLLNQKDGKHLKFMVNNETLGGDPIWGYKKFMIIQFFPEGHENKIVQLGIVEDSEIDFKF